MTDRIWLSSYPEGVPADINAAQYPSLVALMEESFKKYASRTAYSFMGKDITYAQTDSLSRAFAGYLQGLDVYKRQVQGRVDSPPCALENKGITGTCHSAMGVLV